MTRGGLIARVAIMLCMLLAAHGVPADPAGVPSPESAAAYGLDLFFGRQELKGRIASHPSSLPPEVVRCANCHALGTGPDVARSIAPRLSREWLLDLRPRRGGPPTRYDRVAFCALLREGQDPAHVVVNVQMPRYDASDEACDALWSLLIASMAGLDGPASP